MQEFTYFNRDISWLSFNDRVLLEAAKEKVPLMERIRFLGIFSSNLDEFFRVRMPMIQALKKIGKPEAPNTILHTANEIINSQQLFFGKTLQHIIACFKQHNVHIIYNEPIPEVIIEDIKEIFFSTIAGHLQPVFGQLHNKAFFPVNNQLYFHVVLHSAGNQDTNEIVNIPANVLPRFNVVYKGGATYIVFVEDIIKQYLAILFKDSLIKEVNTFKITRDAEMDYTDEFDTDIASAIERQLKKRDFGIATRFLCSPGFSTLSMEWMVNKFQLQNANIIVGGNYHNLSDFAQLTLLNKKFYYESWPTANIKIYNNSLYDELLKKDILVNPPYQSYHTVLRFFNEAAIDVEVTEIYTTLYRAATHSQIINALISAAKNGKQVTVLIELKARFDEAKNIKWAKLMKQAGIKIIYSPALLKVHAKIALVKRKVNDRKEYFALLGTGNLNETTARFYTDHILLTADKQLARQLELLFIFLSKKIKPQGYKGLQFTDLLVAQFNLQSTLLQLIDTEIMHAQQGLGASITLKMNNLEEKKLISKLYEASNAGVKIQLIIRGICCLIPGVQGMSENITIRRIVDRYLEHGRIFIFYNNGQNNVYTGSADWMNRNMYSRIEVCFPIKDPAIKAQLITITEMALRDNEQATLLNAQLENIPIVHIEKEFQSQKSIYEYYKHTYIAPNVV